MAFLSAWLVYRKEKIIDEEEKTRFGAKFNVLFKDFRPEQVPLFYFIFFLRRFFIMMIVNLATVPILRLSLSLTLSISVSII